MAFDGGSRAFPSRGGPVGRIGGGIGADLRLDLLDGPWRPTVAVGADLAAVLAPAVSPPLLVPHASAELALQLEKVAPVLGWTVDAAWRFVPTPAGGPVDPPIGVSTGLVAGVDLGRADSPQLRLRAELTTPLTAGEPLEPLLAVSAGVELPLGKR